MEERRLITLLFLFIFLIGESNGSTCVSHGDDCTYDSCCEDHICVGSEAGYRMCFHKDSCVDEGYGCRAISRCCPGTFCEITEVQFPGWIIPTKKYICRIDTSTPSP